MYPFRRLDTNIISASTNLLNSDGFITSTQCHIYEPVGFKPKQFLTAIANGRPLEIVSLRHMQSRESNWRLIRVLNLTSTFPANYAQSVRYLDLSHNDYEAFYGGFIASFTALKYLDVSYNNFMAISDHLVAIISSSMFHPSLQVIALGSQFQNRMYMKQQSLQRRYRRAAPQHGDGSASFKTCMARIQPFVAVYWNRTATCSFVNCLFEMTSETIPCDYIPLPETETKIQCVFSLLIPMAPSLAQIQMSHFTDMSFPHGSSKVQSQDQLCFGTNTLKSLDLSENSILSPYLGSHELPLHGLDGLVELKLTKFFFFIVFLAYICKLLKTHHILSFSL